MSILRRFTDFVLQGPLQAMGVAFVLAYIPLFGSIGILIAGLVTLRKGALEGLYVTIATSLPYVLKYYISANTGNSADMAYVASIGMSLSLISNGLLWLAAILLRRYNNWCIVLEYVVLLGIVFIGLVHLIYPDIQGWWGTQLARYFDKTSAMMSGLNAPSGDVQSQLVDTLKFYATGLIVVFVFLNVILQLILARWWQAVIFNPGGLRKELQQIKLSHVMGGLFIVGFALSWFKNEVIRDIMPLLYAMFCAAGLSLMHYYLNTKKHSWIWLLVSYLIIIWLFPLSVVVIAVIALLDIWLNFRKRFAKSV